MAGLHDTFRRLSVGKVEALPVNGAEESLHLDFKLTKNSDFSAKDDKETLARAISGFANSEGGLIVWGVDARKNEDGIDCAISAPGVDNVPLFVSRLKELSGDAVSPMLDGVEHRGLRRKNGSGFAVTYVPPSDSGPHMAKLGLGHYYKRNGSSFLKMEHFEIADMFGRRRRARLQLTYRVESRGEGASVVIGLANTGRGSARGPYLSLNIRGGPLRWDRFGVTGNGHEGMARQPMPTRGFDLTYAEGNTFLIHPGCTLDVMRYRNSVTKPVMPDRDVEIDYAVCADEIALESGTLTIPLSELV